MKKDDFENLHLVKTKPFADAMLVENLATGRREWIHYDHYDPKLHYDLSERVINQPVPPPADSKT